MTTQRGVSAAIDCQIFFNFISPSDHIIFFLLCKMFTIHRDVCGDFPKICEDFPKLVQRPDQGFRTFPEDFRTFSKNIEGCRRRTKKIRRCFDHVPTNLGVVKGAKDHFSKMISSHVRISYLQRMWRYHIVFINLFPLGVSTTFIEQIPLSHVANLSW